MARKRLRLFVCPVCLWRNTWRTKKRRIERHHLIPVASGGNGLGNYNIIKLCSRCHFMAHKIWGPGNDYNGPETKGSFITLLKEELLNTRSPRRTSEKNKSP